MHRPNQRNAGLVALAALMAAGLLGACGSDNKTSTTDTTAAPKPASTVSIDMSEFAFTVSGPLTAGGTLKLANKGSEIHMMGMGKLKPGKTLAEVRTALRESGAPGDTSTTVRPRAGVTTTTPQVTTTTAPSQQQQDPTAELVDQIGLPGGVMSPGESAEVTVPDLGVGSYVLICYIPSEGDGAPHFVKGMVNQLDVVAGGAPTMPTADATYTVAPGKPVEGPATLTPGKHTLQINAAPGSEKMEPGLAMLKPGTTPGQLSEALDKIFQSETPPPKGAASQVPGKIVYAGFDLDQITVFFLTVDLEAGNYFLAADDTDLPNPPKDPVEVINITVG